MKWQGHIFHCSSVVGTWPGYFPGHIKTYTHTIGSDISYAIMETRQEHSCSRINCVDTLALTQ